MLVLLLFVVRSALPVLLAAPADVSGATSDVQVRPEDGPRLRLVLHPPDRITIPAGYFRMGATRQQLKRGEALCSRELREAGALNIQVTPTCRLRADIEGPAAEVFVPAFAIDRVEVTRGAYRSCMNEGRCRQLPAWVLPPAPRRDDPSFEKHPIEWVTFWDATRFCLGRGGRLPTEAEWERAARGMGERLFPWGEFFREGLANHGQPVLRHGASDSEPEDGVGDDSDGFLNSAAVGSFPAGVSPYDVADMAGNVWEWTAGVFSHQPPQATQTLAPTGNMFGTQRTIRGGSYLSSRSAMRVTARYGLSPGTRAQGIGFRCAYDLAPPR